MCDYSKKIEEFCKEHKFTFLLGDCGKRDACCAKIETQRDQVFIFHSLDGFSFKFLAKKNGRLYADKNNCPFFDAMLKSLLPSLTYKSE